MDTEILSDLEKVMDILEYTYQSAIQDHTDRLKLKIVVISS